MRQDLSRLLWMWADIVDSLQSRGAWSHHSYALSDQCLGARVCMDAWKHYTDTVRHTYMKAYRHSHMSHFLQLCGLLSSVTKHLRKHALCFGLSLGPPNVKPNCWLLHLKGVFAVCGETVHLSDSSAKPFWKPLVMKGSVSSSHVPQPCVLSVPDTLQTVHRHQAQVPSPA